MSIMKRLVSNILILCMVFSMFSIQTNALTPEEEIDAITMDKIDAFITGVEGLSNKDEFVNMLVLLRDVDNEEDFAAVYTQMFNSLLPGQQDRLTSFGATIQAASDFGNYFMNEEYSISNLEDYLGLGADNTYKPVAFKNSLTRRSEEFAQAVAGISAVDLEAGFERMDKLFGMLALANTIGDGSYFVKFLDYNFTTDVLSQIDSEVAKLVVAANLVLEDDIDNDQTVIDGVQKLVDYVNGESPYEPGTAEDSKYAGISEQDKIRILTYLGKYKFVVYPEPVVETVTTTTTRTRTNNNTVFVEAPEVIDLADTAIPLGGGIFRDLINNYAWAQVAIRQLYIADIIKGKDEDTYDPAGFVTRAEFTAMLDRMFDPKLPEDGPSVFATYESSFTDVVSPAWFVDEIEAAYRAGFVKGVGHGLYAPYANISREQIATMIARVLEDKEIEAPSQLEYDTILARFSDASEVSAWAKPSAAMCVDLGLITGKVVDGQNEFAFSDYATRAEVAVILYRIVENELIQTKVNVFGSELDAPVTQ